MADKGKVLKLTLVSLKGEPCDKVKEMSCVQFQCSYFIDAVGLNDLPTN